MIGKRPTVLAGLVTAATLVPLAVFGGVGLAHGLPSASEYQYGPGGNQYGKMTICHHTHSKKHPSVTITISPNAWKAHLRHHDTQGACPPPAPTVATTHGNSGDHGKSSDSHGNSGNNGNNGNGNGHHK